MTRSRVHRPRTKTVTTTARNPCRASLWTNFRNGSPRRQRRGDGGGSVAPDCLGMSAPWELQITVDAVGSERCRIRPRHLIPDGSSPHLAVRAGPVLVYVLDAQAVTDLASAWAAAHVRGAHLLPVMHAKPARSRRPGAAYPVAEVVVEGRQRWNLRLPEPGRDHLLVTTGWLQVRVHDRVALDTQVRAWAEASAWGSRVFRRRPASFDALLEQAQIRAVREAAAKDDRKIGRGGNSRER